MTAEKHSIEQLAARYYATVDSGDAEATSALFAADASYDRPGYPTMVGQAITDFYHGERIIVSGKHTVTEVLVSGQQAAVQGSFAGTLKDGSEASERFADFLTFNDAGLITNRTTYFYRAAV
ncbi:nuclear transport factor 2 family protein [Brevibacterium luteolum]|uniref:Nuclear transport factor 2 family protein n=1 Tax=Brevibacterium luteolum TaxID=199591 RepID=A0A6G8KWW8_9MICO|nr:nuclear transport factor 2 family protein [Brevibacterium luteolum]QIN29121.1 nuclear transport factor 2 family protein [Brevibacterium luteolum]